ncbi:sortase [Actinomyces sp. Chiba101]|uniref:LPXTG-site transpeptidase (Sortase) family protein n=1 Tax=Actinomyces denticolens TaxID=52767 RepID=A0ABY1IKK9_9ACTO|nr:MULTISPECIES: class C sortase [Actinomyces]BAW93124.1 sortase [Actinomyces sp. Chiba101]GAV95645.1 sortase family protein [Actinomyces denticolens]SHJ30781.1 LPXTG-site transpeptidase (sortase) family protein [Actinomyces denticolens]SUU04887.1 Sortase (surface protein transpeptidase) [Actinomyces denticolens]
MSSTTGTADAASATHSPGSPDRADGADTPGSTPTTPGADAAATAKRSSKRRARRTHRAEPGAKRRWRLRIINLIPAVLALAGLALFSYPSVASWISQYNQSKVVADYEEQVDNARPAAEEQLAQAHAYNNALSSGAILEANTNIPTGAGEHPDDSLDYNKILSANAVGLMGRLRIPTIDLDLPIYHGTSDEVLLAGLGHLQGTSLPVGGKGTRSVITGHRGLANATMFTNLDQVGVGDTFTLEVFGEVLSYQVIETKVVAPEETESLRADPDRDLVTLVTCTPLGINTHRILVTAERITPTPADDLAAAGAKPEIPGFPWWAVWITGVVIAVGLYLWRTGYPPKAAAAKDDDDQNGPNSPARDAQDAKGPGRADGAAAHSRTTSDDGYWTGPRMSATTAGTRSEGGGEDTGATPTQIGVDGAISLRNAATPEDPDAGASPGLEESWSALSPEEIRWAPLAPSDSAPTDVIAPQHHTNRLTIR